MELTNLKAHGPHQWEIPVQSPMRVPGIVYASEALIRQMDQKVMEQVTHVASLPGIVSACYAMPDAHWGYGFPIGGVAAFDPQQGGVISAGGVGFDISCGVRCLKTGLQRQAFEGIQKTLADMLFAQIPAGMGVTGSIRLTSRGMDDMLTGGARWAVSEGWGFPKDLEFIEDQGQMLHAKPGCVSERARLRQRDELGTLGSGNHYLEVQEITTIFDTKTAQAWGLQLGDVVVMIHCGSRGLGHQIGTEFLREMAQTAAQHGLSLPDRELACAPIHSDVGQRYLGAMRAATNCALANRQILTHLTRTVFAQFFPQGQLDLLYDVSHNTCRVERHRIDGVRRELFVHRKGATRALGPGHPDLPSAFKSTGQPVLVGGSMGTESYICAGTPTSEGLAFSSACHGAGRAMSRHQAMKNWSGRQLIDSLSARGVLVRTPSQRAVAEEAPLAYKDVSAVVQTADVLGLARKIARLDPFICIKG